VKALHVQSPAFCKALLESERLRIVILLTVVAVIWVIRVLRTVVAWTPVNVLVLPWITLFFSLIALYELLVLRAVKRTLRSGLELLHPLWLSNIFVEMCLPGLMMVVLKDYAGTSLYRAVTHPAATVGFILIIVSTLRLNPWISAACGAVSAGSFLVAAYVLGWRPMETFTNTSLLSPAKSVDTFALSFVIAGIAAGLVAREIRKQVEAALREAETRREVEHLQHDLDVAHSIQQSLLPTTMPQVPGFDVAAWNKPADQTGGDYYDWQVLPDGRVLLALADVTGHGIGPALLAAVCRAYGRAHFGQQKVFLKAMEQVNSAIAGDVREGRFVTFVAAILGSQGWEVELLSAGQAPLFVYWLKNDRFDKMEAQGLPLGVSSVLESDPPAVLRFESGDLLVLTTDGFFEWANAGGEFFGAGRLEESVRASREKGSAEIIASLYEDVLRYAGGTAQKDDLTAIVIKRV
jgi:serine phosphatase RsbU (regulator of sigma subunit)